MRIGLLTAYLSERGGGVVASTAALAAGLRADGTPVTLFGIREQGQSEPGEAAIPSVGPSAFGFMPALKRALDSSALDVLHSHGLWMYPSVAAMRWSERTGRPLVVSPHGMLDSWALRRSSLKKRVASALFEARNLRRAACLHALTEAEAAAFRAYGLNNPICIVPNGVALPANESDGSAPEWAESIPAGANVLLFLGRLHPKKGLAELIRAWAATAGAARRGQWYLVVAGWDQGHQAGLEALAAELGVDGSIRFVGPQFGAAKDRSFRRAQAFILPSFSEGLPMAVLEAWSYGLPVLMSAECNLPAGFAAGAALLAQADPKTLAGALEDFFALSERERREMGRRGLALVSAHHSWPAIATAMLSVYEWTIGGGPPPAAVLQQSSWAQPR